MVLKLTLDGGLWRESVLLPAVRTLKALEAEGKIEVFEADRPKETAVASGWPGAPKPTVVAGTPGGRGRSFPKKSASGTTFEQVSAVLFPHRDPRKLSMSEINDVAHLLRHQAMGHAAFVTTNVRGFMDDGKRERLQTAFRIVVMTPDEAVAMVREKAQTAEA